MSSKRIKVRKQGEGDISRRQLLQGLGGGIAGGMLAGAFAKPAHATPITLSSTTNPVFDAALPNSTTLIGEANFVNGMLFVRTATPSVNGTQLDMQCFDVQSNQFAFSLSNLLSGGGGAIPPTPFTNPVSDGVFVYTVNQQTLYQMDINGNALQTLPILTGATGLVTTMTLINLNQDLLCWSDGGYLARFNIAAQQNVWRPVQGTDALNTGITPVIMVGGQVAYVYGNQVDGVNGGVFSVNLTSGAAVNPQTPLITLPKGTGASYAQGMIFVSGTKGVVTAHDATTGNQIWQYPSDNSILSGPLLAPVCINNQVLVADAAGILHTISQSTGTGAPTPLPSAPTPSSRIYVEDNIAYLSLGPATSITLFGLAMDTNTPLSYPTQSKGVFVGVQNGVCYFSHNNGQNLAARSFTPDLHGLFSESVLIEDYVPSGSGTIRTPSYRTHMLFLDSNYNPRIAKAIRIWASDTVTIMSGQNTYTVDANNGVWLTTDGAGELPIVVSPDNVTCPNLYIWNTYMLPGDAMMVYPDWDTTNTLANLQSSNMPATNPWDNSPLFSQVNGTDDIAKSIRSSMTGGSQVSAIRAQVKAQIANSSARGRTGHRTAPRATNEVSYIAYPSSNPNMTFAPGYVNVTPTRPFVSSAPSPWTISLMNGTWTYSDGVSATPQVGVSFIKISFHDLLKKCVQDVTETLTKVEAAVDTATNVITHTITTLANEVVQTYELVIDSIEAAAAVVSSVLTSALKTIDSAVKWLSYLFSWGSFIQTQEAITTKVTQGLTNFANQLASMTTDEVTQIQGVLTDVEGKIHDFLTNFVTTATGTSTLQSQQINNNNPQTAYAANGGQSYSQTKWLSTKLQANAGQATMASTAFANPALGGSPSGDILQAFEQMFTSVGQSLAKSEFTHIPGDLKTLVNGFSNLWKNPTKFVETTFATIINLLIDLIVGFLQFLGDVVTSILTAIPTILNAVIGLLTTPLNIPVISDIWRAIDNSNPLTMLNAVALVVAIPATIVQKFGSAASQAVSAVSSVGVSGLETVLVFSGVIYAGVDSDSDLENLSNSGVAAYLGLALSAISFAFSVPFDTKPTDFVQWLYYILSAGGLVISGITIGIDESGTQLTQDIWQANLPDVNNLYGTLMFPFTLLVGLGYNLFGVVSMLANVFGYLPYIGKITATGPAFSFPDQPQRAIAAAVDVVGDLTSAILNTVSE